MRIEIVFGPYNSRRFGRPWGAKVEFEGTKMVYDFKAGHYLGDDRGGNVYIECNPGDLIAYGQRDGRGNGTMNVLAIVNNDGSLQEVDKTAALEHFESRKDLPENPLSHISTADLIAELKRRGVKAI